MKQRLAARCDCGRRAVKYKNGPVCERCDQIEQMGDFTGASNDCATLNRKQKSRQKLTLTS